MASLRSSVHDSYKKQYSAVVDNGICICGKCGHEIKLFGNKKYAQSLEYYCLSCNLSYSLDQDPQKIASKDKRGAVVN